MNDINKPVNENGLMELHLAAYHQDIDWVKNCLQAGFDVNKISNNSYTDLVWAIDMAATSPSGVAEEIIDCLLESDADIGINNTGYPTLLDFAKEVDHEVYEHLSAKKGLW